MNTKKIVFLSSLVGVLFIGFLFSLENSYCYNNAYCLGIRHALNIDILDLIFLTIPLFFLSLITYRLRDEIFTAWWNFARWWVLAIIIITFILNSMSGGGTLGMDRDFTAFTLIILYSILSVGSLVKITRTHVRLRGEEKGLSPVEQDHLKRKTNLYIIATVVLFIVVLVAIG